MTTLKTGRCGPVEGEMTLAIITCSPYFTDLALNEICRHHPNSTPLTEIAPGKILLHTSTTYHQFTRAWQDKLPIYLHHCCPVDKVVLFENDPIADIYQAARGLIQPQQPMSVQTRIMADESGELYFPYMPEDINDSLAHTIPELESSDPCPVGQVLSVVVNPCREKWWAYLGVSWANQNLSPYHSGFRPIEIDLPNRAGCKLIEALETFEINLRAGDYALDLGAAPGAWTIVLRQHGLHVTAVAPQAMYSFLRDDPMIDIFQGYAEDYAQQLHDVHRADRQFDLITNDMIVDGDTPHGLKSDGF